MIFDLFTMFAICNGYKKVTRRLFRKARPAVPTAENGKLQKIKIDRTPMVYGELEILACYTSTLGDMTEEDAKLEGFHDLEEYKMYFYRTNGYIPDDVLIWVVEFEPVWTNKKGVIL
jgi:hypothetical protein